jgi:hypothetical protein
MASNVNYRQCAVGDRFLGAQQRDQRMIEETRRRQSHHIGRSANARVDQMM